MFNKHIQAFHFENPAKKTTKEWAYQAIQSLYYNTGRRNLLHGKNIKEIDEYATGDINMKPFKMMYKSIAEKERMIDQNRYAQGDVEQYMQFNPYPLIPAKLNSAVATMQKVPFEITVKAMDALAVKKKKEDLNYLKNKPAIEADLQGIADRMQLGKVDLGPTKYSAIPYSSSPYGLDLNEPDELQVFVDLLYNLSVEASFETALQIFYEMKNLIQLRLLECHSHLRYGVSCHCAFESEITGLPDVRYIFPAAMEVPYSELPDMSDRTHEFENMEPTVMELFNMFGDEIRSLKDLENIINGEYGYCERNKRDKIDQKDWGTFKTSLIYCKVKSVDWIGVRSMVNEDGELFSEFTMEEDEASEKIWAQNTYAFYWLKNTRHIFKVHKLGFAHRKHGQEQYQGFDTNIYRSQEKSAVEQSIGENKKAQVASIKIEHAIIKSLPAGKVIDLKGMRGVLDGALKDEANQFTMESLIQLAVEENIIIIDTEGFDGKNDGQLKPFYEIAGGIKSELIGYMNVIAEANAKIAQFTGINEQLTGTSANPEGLIGLQKLLINSSINSLYYIQEGMTLQYQKLMNIWAYLIKEAIEEGGAVKEAFVNFIGKEKTEIIDGLSDLPLHTMGVTVKLSQREEERAKFAEKVNRLLQQGILSIADEYMLDAIQNPKDKIALLAVKEKRFRDQSKKEQERKFQEQQQLLKQNSEQQLQIVQAEKEAKKEEIYTKGEVQGKILTLANQLGLSDIQMESLAKRALQKDRGIDQERKAVSTINAKANAEAQKSVL